MCTGNLARYGDEGTARHQQAGHALIRLDFLPITGTTGKPDVTLKTLRYNRLKLGLSTVREQQPMSLRHLNETAMKNHVCRFMC